MGWGRKTGSDDDPPPMPFKCDHKTVARTETVDKDGKPWKIQHWCECGILIRTTNA